MAICTSAAPSGKWLASPNCGEALERRASRGIFIQIAPGTSARRLLGPPPQLALKGPIEALGRGAAFAL